MSLAQLACQFIYSGLALLWQMHAVLIRTNATLQNLDLLERNYNVTLLQQLI